MELKETLERYLVAKGFASDDKGKFTKTLKTPTNEVWVFNGRKVDNSAQLDVVISYIDGGYIDEEPLEGFNININGRNIIDLWSPGLNDFDDFLKRGFEYDLTL